MATSGLYKLLVNNGSQDKLLMATDLLNKRLKDVEKLRCKNPAVKDTTPTLADIEATHLLFINSHFKPFVSIAYEYNRIGVQEGIIDFGSSITFSIPQFGDFFNDMVLNVKISGLSAGITSTQARYCDFIGHRLLQQTKFEVNANDLDQYSSHVYNFHYQFMVPENKKRAWKQCVGQEVPNPAYLTQNPLVDEYRELKNIVSGPQTPKVNQPDVDLWIPLLFWFNLDPRLAIPSVSIPYGQRFIKMKLATLDQIAQGVPFPDVTAPKITLCELYINNIFVNPEIHDIFIKKIGFTLIRVHRESATILDTADAQILQDQLKYPVETMFMGVQPNINLTSMENWHRYSFVIDTPRVFPVAIANPFAPPDWVIAFSPAVEKVETPVIDTISVTTVGIELWKQTDSKFFNRYIPYAYGGNNISAPEDSGVFMIPFNLYPGSYQPSGHINLSRTREFYINYTSSVISSIIKSTMYVVAIAINFLLVSDGSAVLRYNT